MEPNGWEHDALYREHVAGVMQLAALLGAEDPADVAAEAFVRLFERARHLPEREALAWVRAVACNLTRSRWRHTVVVRRTLPRLVPVPTGAPEELAIDADEVSRLIVAIEGLPTRQREVIVLRYWTELSEREIAATLGISSNSVKQHARRATARIRKELGDGS